MSEPQIQNVLTLWQDAVPAEKIPAYPTFKIKTAVTGKEITYYIDPEARPGVIVRRRQASIGEDLRDNNMKFSVDVTENLKHRIHVQQLAEGNSPYQELQYVLAKSSILYFVNTFCWTYDPRLSSLDRQVPFVTYPFQDDVLTWVLWCVEYNQEGLIEKSRDMGMSWIMAAVAAYLVLFYSKMSVFFMSMREEDVDDRTEDSLLQKVRFILNNVPGWMRQGWVEKGNDDRKMSFMVPETKSIVKGILSKGTAGRSGRATIVFADEFAFVEDSQSVLKALSELSPCKIYLSSVNGMGNEFARMAHDPNVNKKTLHWLRSGHPLKSLEWAKKERAKPAMTEEVWAQEHDICYETSTSGRVFPQFISFVTDNLDKDGNYTWSHIQTGDYFTYDSHYDVDVGMDFGMSAANPTSILLAQVKPALPEYQHLTKEMIVFIGEMEDYDATVWDYRKWLNDMGYRYRHFVGDMRTGNQRDSGGSTWIKNFAQQVTAPVFSKKQDRAIMPGPPILVTGKYNSEHAPIQVTQQRLSTPGALAINPNLCPNLIKTMQNWAYPVDKDTGRPIVGAKPNHDRWSHQGKAAVYLMDYLYGGTSKEKQQEEARPWGFRTSSVHRM